MENKVKKDFTSSLYQIVFIKKTVDVKSGKVDCENTSQISKVVDKETYEKILKGVK